VAGGLATFASFPPTDAWPLAVAGPALLVVALTGRSLRASFGCGLAFGLAQFVPLLSWLINMAWYAWFALAVAEAVIFAALAVGQRLLLRLPFWPAAVAGWWVTVEAVRDRWPYAFPWGRLAMSQSVAPDVRWVAIGGAPLLTFLVALTGAMIAWSLCCLGGSDPPQTPPALGGTGSPPKTPGPPGRTGRNLPVAVAVGAALGGLVLLTLFTVKATFLLYMGAALAVALAELAGAFAHRDIAIPVIPVAAGGAAVLTCTYWLGPQAALAALALTVVALFAWRLPGGTSGYVKDVTAGVFAVLYLPVLASFVVAMLVPADGARRVLTFVILVICSDIGGYFAGITLGRGGRHPMAPVISPKKTWEGFAGSAAACLAAGALCVTLLLHGHAWQGLLAGAAAVLAATLGDLAESMIKRDLGIKDMGTLLPGHGGILDRIDSLLVAAPAVWLLLYLFIPAR
jgi:phosphatidate cytidylyltransferase